MTRFGSYIERWEAEAVARSLRAEGKRVGVRKISEYHWTVVVHDRVT